MTSMQKKVLLPIVVVVLLLVGFGGYLATRGKSQVSDEITPQKKKVEEPVNIIPVSERPYVQIAPVADGRNVELIVKSLNKTADQAEFELEYQSGSLLQGAFGLLELDQLPARETILLGSCSAGGKCTFHEDVKGGSLKLKFTGDEPYAVKSDWRYFENTTKETAFSSKDAKFQIEAPQLGQQPYVIIYNSPGHPEVAGQVVSDVYSLAVSKPLTGTASLTIRSAEEGNLQILGWDGTTWQEFESQTEGKMVKAEVELLELFVVVKK